MNLSNAPDPGAFGFGDCLVDPGVLDRDDAIYALCIHHQCPAQCLVLRRAEATLDNAFAPLPLRMRYFDADAGSEEPGFADYSDLAAMVRELQVSSAQRFEDSDYG